MHPFLYAILFMGVLLCNAQAQTIVVAHPVSDANGWVAFQVDHVLRTEGHWDQPPAEGQFIYPQPMKRAYPLARFGESVIISFPEAGRYNVWKGYHVHNGCIPALSGEPANGFLKEIARLEPPPAEVAGRPAVGDVRYRECPICHQKHIRY